MKRISLILILILTLGIVLSSCGNRDYDEAVVKAETRVLLEKSKAINEVFYGVGMTVDSSLSSSITGYYKPVSKEYLGELGVSNLNGLRELTKEVYTEELSELIFQTKLNSVKDSAGNVVVYARYFETKVNNEQRVMVYTAADPMYENDVDYLYDTLVVRGSDKQHIIVELDVKLTTFDGFSRVERIEILLLEEKDGFRLDTLSFAKY